MNPLKLTRVPLADAVLKREVELIRQNFLQEVQPVELYLFGSAAECQMTDQSDFDLLIVMSSQDAIRQGQTSWKKIRPSLPKRAYDLVWMTEESFMKKRSEGGVAMIAYESGMKLI